MSVAVICERRMAAKVKGKIYKIAVRLAMMSGLETVTQPKRQQEELQSPRQMDSLETSESHGHFKDKSQRGKAEMVQICAEDRCSANIEQQMLNMVTPFVCPAVRQQEKATEKIYGCKAGGHVKGWCDRGEWQEQAQMETDDPLCRPRKHNMGSL